ncbi:MAG: hypothetical protein EG825_11720 [Rhodocyclaceae bacterium]|nr:hypothetical protein [Rhodocyclaceae bacterium]
MTPLPYALLDRICDLAAHLDEQGAEALAEMLRRCKDGPGCQRVGKLARLLLDADNRGRLDILLDTWTFIAPRTLGIEIAAALVAAGAQARRGNSGAMEADAR